MKMRGGNPKDLVDTNLWRAKDGQLLTRVTDLLKKGANVNAVDQYDMTPLHYAAESKAPIEVVKLLLKKGANVNANDTNNTTPLQIILNVNDEEDANDELVELLLEQENDENNIKDALSIAINSFEYYEYDIITKILSKCTPGMVNTEQHLRTAMSRFDYVYTDDGASDLEMKVKAMVDKILNKISEGEILGYFDTHESHKDIYETHFKKKNGE